ATLRNLAGSYPVEILLVCGLVWFGRRRAEAGEPAVRPPDDRGARGVAQMVVFALVINLAVLPLYGYQDYSYRHYLGFGLPLLWLVCGRALALLGAQVVAGVRRISSHVAGHRTVYLIVAIAAVLAANLGPSSTDASWAVAGVSKWFSTHWVRVLLIVLVVALRRPLVRPPWFPRIAVLVFTLIYSIYRPNVGMKRGNLVWRAADDRVWASLGQRTGVVSSFALQGEVAWNTGRKNIPAPEWPMHIYSMAYDHHLEIEDVYIESAASLISRVDGPFALAAPGFEGYARLQTWRTMPGYEVAFHADRVLSYPQFRIEPHYKASTDFELTDRAAIAAMARSPGSIALGDPAQVIYTAHGWGGYYTVDGKPVVAATDITRIHHRGVQGPHEDTSVTFFLDDRRPSSVDVAFYTPVPASYQWYWNLDLYAYDRPKDRPSHAVGSYEAAAAGWHTAHLVIPPEVTRAGLNKLGFRVSALQPVVLCPQGISDEGCLTEHERTVVRDRMEPEPPHAIVLRPPGVTAVHSENISMFASSIEFHYEPPGGPAR
ncbi:MAG TPA: hypothetical protein VHW23_04080, partial [Kofleriaceae bacterium]|nr:hypothetical protein [Kofleriaceae bacterium]